jgi:hypothetical protein
MSLLCLLGVSTRRVAAVQVLLELGPPIRYCSGLPSSVGGNTPAPCCLCRCSCSRWWFRSSRYSASSSSHTGAAAAALPRRDEALHSENSPVRRGEGGEADGGCSGVATVSETKELKKPYGALVSTTALGRGDLTIHTKLDLASGGWADQRAC